MKRIIALLLAIMMLPIFTVVSQAAMTRDEFREVLVGDSDGHLEAILEQANLKRAYKNISMDELTALRNFHNNFKLEDVKLPAGFVNDLPTAVGITEDEAKVLVYGFIKLMTFPNEKNGAEVAPVKDHKNIISEKDIDRAADVFCTEVPGTGVSPNEVLDKVANGTMHKHALGGMVYNIQTNLRKQAKEDAAAFLKTFQAPIDTFQPNVKGMVEKALAAAFDEATPANAKLERLYVVKQAMLGNGYLKENGGAIDPKSPFIKLVLTAFDVMDDTTDGKVALSVVFNTIMSGVMDVSVNVYETHSTSIVKKSIEPNQEVPALEVNDVCYIDVIPGFTLGDDKEDAITLTITSNLEGDSTNGVVELAKAETGNRIKITGKAEGTGIIKLYRNLDTKFDNQMCDSAAAEKDALPELFMELCIKVTKESDSESGGGGAPITKRVEAPTITFEVDGAGNITVSLETATEGATIYYTTTGLSPTEKSQKYEGPFQVPDGTTIKAFAVKPGYIDSYVSTDTIKLDEALKPTLTGEHIAYVHGRDTGNFDAEDNVTRGEVAAIFSRLLVKKMVFKDNSTSKFTDVVEGAWHTPYIKYLTNVNIINGYEDGTFRPDAPITRAELATVASRFFDLEQGSVNVFSDVSDSHWAKPYIDSAVIKGWILGYEDGTFKPDQAIKRSETVTIVNRMLNRVADKTYIAEHYDEVLDYPDLDESYWAYYEILEASNWHDHKVTNNKEIWTDIFYQERFNAS
ncbi:MAG: S-layer homology domain-containing protein [Clostridia bacterium]|nr:S-layer homology domain-containing protein [Clostridia bacterium]